MLHGAHGSDQWNAGGNKAWPKFIEALGCLALWLPQTRTLHPVALIAGSAALGILFHM